MNLLPRVWGPPAWMFLYTMALGYPNSPTPDEQSAARDFLLSLQQLLPCDKCRVNYRAKMLGGEARLNEALACSETLTRYIYDLEAAVAASNGSSIRSYTDTRAAIMSNSYLKRDTVRTSSTALAIAIPITIIITALVSWAVTRAVVKTK